MRVLVKVLTVLSLLVNFSYSNVRDIIIDSDVGPDDWVAISYLLSRPDINVLAITLTGTGVADCSHGVKNVRGILAMGWPWNIPVVCGSNFAYKEENYKFPNDLRQMMNNIIDLKLPYNDSELTKLAPSKTMAADLIVDILKNSDSKIDIVEIGPYTNIALALDKDSSIVKSINSIYSMGGAIYVDGNIDPEFGKDYAEANFASDPFAVKRVFETDIPITLVSLDATRFVPVNSQVLSKFEHINSTRGQFIYNVISGLLNIPNPDGWFFWDDLTAVVFTNPEIVKYKNVNLEVVVDDSPKQGQTIVTDKGRKVRMITKVDTAGFESILAKTIKDYR